MVVDSYYFSVLLYDAWDKSAGTTDGKEEH